MLACEKETPKIAKQNQFDVPFRSSPNESVLIKDESSKLVFKIKNISDQRCANHLICNDLGEATVRIEVMNDDNSKAESLLRIGVLEGEFKSADSVKLKLDNSWYVIKLLNVSPHPMAASNEVQNGELSIVKDEGF